MFKAHNKFVFFTGALKISLNCHRVHWNDLNSKNAFCITRKGNELLAEVSEKQSFYGSWILSLGPHHGEVHPNREQKYTARGWQTLCLTDAVAVTFFLDANTLVLPREAIPSVSGDITLSQDALALSVPTWHTLDIVYMRELWDLSPDFYPEPRHDGWIHSCYLEKKKKRQRILALLSFWTS